jgi:hypothetical protein
MVLFLVALSLMLVTDGALGWFIKRRSVSA